MQVRTNVLDYKIYTNSYKQLTTCENFHRSILIHQDELQLYTVEDLLTLNSLTH